MPAGKGLLSWALGKEVIIAVTRLYQVLTGRSLFLLKNDSIDGHSDANAEGSKNSKRHRQRLMFHPVQVVHMLGMKVVRLVMAMCMPTSHPFHPS